MSKNQQTPSEPAVERPRTEAGAKPREAGVYCDNCDGGPWANEPGFIDRAREGNWRHGGCGGHFVFREAQ